MAGVLVDHSSLKVCVTISEVFFFFSPSSFLFSPVSSTPVFSILNAMVVIVLLERSSIFRDGGFIFIAQLVCQRSHNLAMFPVVKN